MKTEAAVKPKDMRLKRGDVPFLGPRTEGKDVPRRERKSERQKVG